MKCLLHRVHSLFGDMDSIIRNGNSALSKSNGGGGVRRLSGAES